MDRTLDADGALALWERLLAVPVRGRGDALAQLASSGDAPPRTPGERNLCLMRLHGCWFGSRLPLLSGCPACGTTVEFDVDCDALARQLRANDTRPVALPHRLEADGHHIEFRLPELTDLADVDVEDDFVQSLLERCVLACRRGAQDVPVRALPAAVLDALSERMEALDPAANLSFALRCPQCAAAWDTRLDLGALVWQKLQAAAEAVLLDVDTLARAYGWTEPEVLRLSPARRAAYLQLAQETA